MRDLEDIMSEGSGTVATLIQEAFEAGRAQGRQEATRVLQARLSSLFDDVQSARAETVTIAQTIAADFVDQARRASPGSVRPTIERHLTRAKDTGLTTDDLFQKTGIKLNSVRGTLWTLGKEELAVKREGRWFPSAELLRRQMGINAVNGEIGGVVEELGSAGQTTSLEPADQGG